MEPIRIGVLKTNEDANHRRAHDLVHKECSERYKVMGRNMASSFQISLIAALGDAYDDEWLRRRINIKNGI